MNTMARKTRKNNDSASIIFSILDLVTKVSNELTERADVRTCRYFPAKASVTGISLPAGDYTVSVDFMAGSHVSSRVVKDVSVRGGKLNFVEATCLR